MTEEQALLNAAFIDPGEETHKLVWADWADEHRAGVHVDAMREQMGLWKEQDLNKMAEYACRPDQVGGILGMTLDQAITRIIWRGGTMDMVTLEADSAFFNQHSDAGSNAMQRITAINPFFRGIFLADALTPVNIGRIINAPITRCVSALDFTHDPPYRLPEEIFQSFITEKVNTANIRSVNLTGNLTTGAGWQGLFVSRGLPNLIDLSISSTGFDGVAALQAKTLSLENTLLTRLMRLDLSHNPGLTNKFLAAALPKMGNIRILDLGRTGMQIDEAMANSIAASLPNLNKLILDGTRISDKAPGIIIKGCKSLQYISAEGCTEITKGTNLDVLNSTLPEIIYRQRKMEVGA